MSTARAVYREGSVVLHDPVDWNDGVELEVRPVGPSSDPLKTGDAKPGADLLAYLDQLSIDEPGCFLSAETLDRLSLLQEVAFGSPSPSGFSGVAQFARRRLFHDSLSGTPSFLAR